VKILLLLSALLTLSTTALAKGQIAVIAAKNSRLGTLTVTQAKAFFLGEDQLLPSGERVAPVDQGREASITIEFYRALAGMNLRDLSVHWAKKVFTGMGMRLPRVEGDAEVKAWVSSRPTGIGYVSHEAVDASVKTLLLLDP
jgi:ABC-type phosphate transport system substrate-binding protein